jgi:heme A synthase
MPTAISTPFEGFQDDESTGIRRAFPRLMWGVLGYTVAVVLEGAIVRATGSGAGCGNHWPLCNGQIVFGTPALAKVIEFTHRAMTGGDGFMVLCLLAGALYGYPKGHPVRLGAGLSAFFLVTEVFIGAALVVFGLVVDDPSPARAAVLSLHLANTLALLGSLTVTAWWANHPRIRLSGRAWASLAAVAFLGITGVLAALADTLYPAHSLAAGFAQDLSPDANFLLRLRAMHPFVAAAVGLWIIYYAALRAPGARRAAQAVIVLVVAQILAGVLNLALLTPIGMQMIHLLLADLLWIALVVLCASPAAVAITLSKLP